MLLVNKVPKLEEDGVFSTSKLKVNLVHGRFLIVDFHCTSPYDF